MLYLGIPRPPSALWPLRSRSFVFGKNNCSWAIVPYPQVICLFRHVSCLQKVSTLEKNVAAQEVSILFCSKTWKHCSFARWNRTTPRIASLPPRLFASASNIRLLFVSSGPSIFHSFPVSLSGIIFISLS